MQELLIIVKIGLLLYAITTFFSYQNQKNLIKEQRAKLFSNRRDTDLSEEERSAISELWELEVTSSEVYCIDEPFEIHAIPSEDSKGEDMYALALANYPIMMSEKAIDYIEEGKICADVVLFDDILIVLGLNDYRIADEVNDILTEVPNTEVSDARSENQLASEQTVLDQSSNSDKQGSLLDGQVKPETLIQTPEDNAPIEPAVFKSERPVTPTEARYLHLAKPFYNLLVPVLLIAAIGIFLRITDLGFTLWPNWVSAVILAAFCSATLLLLIMERPKPDPTTLSVKRYFGKIIATTTKENKTWIVFIAPNGESKEAWIPNQWQNTVALDCDVQFEIEQSQSAVMRIGLNTISEQDSVKKKPRYIAAAIGLLFGTFFIGANTHFEWREASLAILDNHSSYQINSASDWPTNELRLGDHLSITQPRLCLDSHDKNNRLVYCKQFAYPLAEGDFKFTPNASVIDAYIEFVTNAPDFAPEMPQNVYNYLVSLAEISKGLGLRYGYNYNIGGYDRIRERREMNMFTPESLQKIAKHITQYCPLDAPSTESHQAGNPSFNSPKLTDICTDFKQQFGVLWQEATTSTCDTSLCWQEALQGVVLVKDKAVTNREDDYFSSLHHLKNEIWQLAKASLALSPLEQASITLDWVGQNNQDMTKVITLRSKLDRDYANNRIEQLKELLVLQTAAAQQNIEVTILGVAHNDGRITLTVTNKISAKQALDTIIHLSLIAFFGLLVALLCLAYYLSGQPRKGKPAKAQDAWIR
ncbi:hypothetical protein [Vibrio neptunius]|uniref:hypothetical protein n=1 Tax=Vibrio neptunius TaxID=170651 RepID=UPI0019D1FC5B|nr:hypothetical protein [Vibrio neptunius]MBN3573213.1 hypothetical protein [Vibrio neptunius]